MEETGLDGTADDDDVSVVGADDDDVDVVGDDNNVEGDDDDDDAVEVVSVEVDI